MGGEVLSPGKVLYTSIGECQDWEWEWVGWGAGGRGRRGHGNWLVHIVVLHIGLQTPLAPWVLSLAPLLGAL